MKLKKIADAVEALNALQQKELNIAESFKLINLMQQVEPHLKNYTEQRQKLLQKYGKTEDKINFVIPKKNVNMYLKEIEPLENIEIEIKFEKIKLNKDINIKAIHLEQLLDGFAEIEEGD